MSARPTRIVKPTAKLGADNDAELEISAHRNAVAGKRAEATATAKSPENEAHGSTSPGTTPSPDPTEAESEDQASPSSLKRAFIVDADDEAGVDDEDVQVVDDDEPQSTPRSAPKKKRKQQHQGGTNVHIQSIDLTEEELDGTLNKTKPSADIHHFFAALPKVPGQKTGQVNCKVCRDGKGYKKETLRFHATTLRRHMEAYHPNRYREWATKNKFRSMLPGDRKAAKEEQQKLEQSRVTDHFNPAPPTPVKEKPLPYSNDLLRQVALEWLIQTDQPLSALEHPALIKFVETAARAVDAESVKLPNRKQSREDILKMFKQQMTKLRDRLNSKAVSGEVSLTCDAWQASNADAYFAVTGHWIEELTPGEWVEQHALFGFTLMNSAHNGITLGNALYTICDRLGIVHKIGHVTCDNASNNSTMLEHFGLCYKFKTGKTFDVAKRHIRCLAHIINLATQALISTRSKAKYYSADAEDAHIPDLSKHTDKQRDEIGLVRSICVKARSSAVRKQLLKTVQQRENVPERQLLLDMKVRWGSTSVMLRRAESQRRVVNDYIYELGLLESNTDKRRKIDDLKMSGEEWTRVRYMCNLLDHAELAQHAFSAAARPSLHNALPAIEKLYSSWDKASEKERYTPFHAALEAARMKLNEYYEKTAASDAHIIAMVLDPASKFAHFKKHWSAEFDDVLETVQKKFIERFKVLNAGPTTTSLSHSKKKTSSFARRNHDDTESESDDDSPASPDPLKPWLGEWNAYCDTHEVVPTDMGIVRWWGLNASRYPTWASLARDYLAVMASSVSSERAFSAAGITISKRRNRLQGDIVEALQVLKWMFNNDIIFRQVDSLQEVEFELEEAMDVDEQKHYVDVVTDGFSWDQLLADDDSL